jgi:hypothetical protein
MKARIFFTGLNGHVPEEHWNPYCEGSGPMSPGAFRKIGTTTVYLPIQFSQYDFPPDPFGTRLL